MNMEEMNQEVLECARYGEEEDLRALLNAGADVNFADVGGSSAMHKAAANGEEACLKVLHQFGAKYTKNGQGNTPAHWAAQNGKAAALKFIIQNYEVDVLAKNDLGRSILTEAFQSKCTDCIELCLSHDSASEERLINPDGKAAGASAQPADAGATETDTQMQVDSAEDAAQNAEANAITHTMQFGEARIRVRELPITRADNPFGTETAPEDDTTGLSVWPAAILLGQWVAQMASREGVVASMRDKVVLELGAGCGLPAIVAAHTLRPKVAYVSDIHDPTLENAAHNVQLNAEDVMDASEDENLFQSSAIAFPPSTSGAPAHSTALKVIRMSWTDTSSYPAERAQLLLGSDLVYDSSILAVLIPAICSTLAEDGSLLYCAPDTGRQGMQQLEDALLRVNIVCTEKFPAPEEFYANPLREVEGDEFVLHFYDLSAKQPHTMYHFQWRRQLPQEGASSVPDAESTPMVE